MTGFQAASNSESKPPFERAACAGRTAAALYCGLSPAGFDRLRKAIDVPEIRLPNNDTKPLFRFSDLDEILARYVVTSNGSVDGETDSEATS